MLRTGTLLRFGAGQTGAQVLRDTPAVLLPIFMTTMLGVPAWLAGVAILVPKLWVILCDPLVGARSDMAKARRGRTPFLLAGALLSGIGFVALFAYSDYASPVMAAGTICLIYLVTITGFSLFSVPYLAIASELSDDAHERTRILVFRMLFTNLGVILGVGFGQPIIHYFGGKAEGWRALGLIFGPLCLAFMLVTAIGLRRVPLLGRDSRPIGLREQFGAAWRDRPFLILAAMHFLQTVAQACSYTVVGFIFLYVVGDVTLMPLFTIVMCGVGMAAQPFWLAMSRRHGKLASFVAASVGWSLVTVSWLWLGGFGAATIGGLRVEILFVMIRAALIGVLNGGFLLLVTSLLTDTVEASRRTLGLANEGGLSGFWSALEKLAFAVGPLIAGGLLSAMGFVSSKGAAAAQGPRAIRAIVQLYSVVPAAIFAASLLLLIGYRRAFAAAGGRP